MLFKKNPVLALISGVIILLSCRRPEPCQEATSILNFVSFSNTETDSIVLKQYVKNGAFDSLMNSTVITRNNSIYNSSNDTLHIQTPNDGEYGLQSAFDYEVYMPAANKLFQISHITEQPTEINMGLSLDKRGCVNPVKSYTLNGKVISGKDNYAVFYLNK
jgi:hypothetical protein